MTRFATAAALSSRQSACFLSSKVQLLQLASLYPEHAFLLHELSRENRSDRDYGLSLDILKMMAAVAPEQWTGIPYELPGVGKTGATNYQPLHSPTNTFRYCAPPYDFTFESQKRER